MCERVNVMYGGMFVETGSAEQLFGTPRHPYTLGLLQSVPRLDAARRDAAASDRGLAAEHAAARRPRARSSRAAATRSTCRARQVPQLVEIEPGHKVACFNPVPLDEWSRIA